MLSELEQASEREDVAKEEIMAVVLLVALEMEGLNMKRKEIYENLKKNIFMKIFRREFVSGVLGLVFMLTSSRMR